MVKVSPSSLNTFLQCPRKWFYQHTNAPQNYVDDTKALLGSAIHGLIEVYFSRQKDNPTPEEIEKLAWDIFESTFSPIIKNNEGHARTIWRNFIKFEKSRLKSWERYKPELVEASFELTSGLRGIVDFYCCGRIIDWKTGTFYYLKKEHVLQGNFYKYMLTKAEYPVKEVIFVYLGGKQPKPVKIPLKTDGWIENYVRKMREMINKGYFPKRTGAWCNWCEYRLYCEMTDMTWTRLRWWP